MGYASLCVLSYNRPQLLRECIEGAVAKAEYPFELIVHDDGSDDFQLLEYLHSQHLRGNISTLVLNSPGHNQGVGLSMKRMFQLATGDPLIKIDQDLCQWRQGWLRETVDILEDNRLRPERGKDWEPAIGALGAFRYWTNPVDHRKMLKRTWPTWEECKDFVGSFMAIPRDVYEEYGPFETHSDAFAEDIAFKRKLKALGLVMAMPKQDLCANQGFGPGPSTVVTSFDPDKGGTVASIHHGPSVFGGEK